VGGLRLGQLAYDFLIVTLALLFKPSTIPLERSALTAEIVQDVAAALAPRLKGLNITTDLMQVGKVVTGQQF
jgi:hypothetical protein